MALTDPTPLALPAGAGGAAFEPLGALSRPTNPKAAWRRWLFTVDHKKIGTMYGAAALCFFIIGGCEALLIRSQLWAPRGTLLSAETYNQVFTMHGTTMVFLVVMPVGAAFANYLMPLQIGARDVAFPRINAFSFWCFLAGGLFLNSSWLFGGGADGGWFNYAPNSGVIFSPGHGIDYWNLGLIITGIASLTGAVNLIVTVLNMRCPGMTMFRMPVFTWMTLVTQFLLLFAIPVLTTAQFLLMFDRLFHANFFNVQSGGNPLLWENLFWVFGHPEVYLMILPAFGLVSEILPVFACKPIFGYRFIVYSGIAIGFMGWGVWAHHMFVSGIGPISVTTFSLTTMFIAVPTGVKILNWTATMWGGKLRFTTPMLFSIGLITMFTIGGLSGVTDSVAPSDTQQHDTYFIVAHFHYVLFGGAFLGFMGGFYFYWPKVFGYLLNERVGKTNFWVMLLGFNLTFGPMHVLGLQGMSWRIYTYDAGYGFEFWNKVATIGAFILAFSVAMFIFNIFYSWRKSKVLPPPGPDPWDARTIEWMTPSPVPEWNFDPVPTVTRLDDFWYRKYADTADHKLVRIHTTEEVTQHSDGKGVHLPSPSYWPIVAAFSLPIIAYGLLYTLWLCLVGGLVLAVAIFGWALEPPDAPGGGHGDDHGPDAEGGADEHAEVTDGSADVDAGSEADSTKEVETLAEISAALRDEFSPTAHIDHNTNTGISNTKLGIWLFLASECLLFGGLITTYLLYKVPVAGEGPAPKQVYDLGFTSVSSFLLLMSSLTMVLAVAAIERGDHHRLRTWLAATALLGATFVSGQVYEFTVFVHEGMGFTTSRSSSAFYTLTGFHGVHVTIGIIMLVSLLILSLRGKLPEHRAETVETVGLYWHFVDVVWIVIFAVVYLIP